MRTDTTITVEYLVVLFGASTLRYHRREEWRTTLEVSSADRDVLSLDATNTVHRREKVESYEM
jgi:hypothetical protein